MKLYDFFRSSAAFRVRIALNLKGLDHERVAVDLGAGEQFADTYKAVNPQSRVPSLEDDGAVLFQSLAIVEYLDETRPTPPLLPADALGRARVRGLAAIVACDIHPLNNLAVLQYLEREMGLDADKRQGWYATWVGRGFAALEALLTDDADTGRFCHGDAPGLADIALVPQVFNAKRFECDLAPYPTLMRVFDACMALDAFDRAQPAKHPDAPPPR